MAIFEKLRQLRDLSRRPARRIAAPDRFRPALESLEDRTVPTVVYTPYFGQETLIQTTGGDYNYATISGASVDLIFWGHVTGAPTTRRPSPFSAKPRPS